MDTNTYTNTGVEIEVEAPKEGVLTRIEKLKARQEHIAAKFRQRPKKCVKCGEKKLGSEFGNNAGASDGLQSYCKSCKNALGKRRRSFNVAARLKHHMSTRITSQLGIFAPEHLTRDLELHLGYRMLDLSKHLSADLKKREGKSRKLRMALEEGYHIDHIKPLSSFRVLSTDGAGVDWDEFQKCWRLDNLTAISASENLAKGAIYNEKEHAFTDS